MSHVTWSTRQPSVSTSSLKPIPTLTHKVEQLNRENGVMKLDIVFYEEMWLAMIRFQEVVSNGVRILARSSKDFGTVVGDAEHNNTIKMLREACVRFGMDKREAEARYRGFFNDVLDDPLSKHPRTHLTYCTTRAHN